MDEYVCVLKQSLLLNDIIVNHEFLTIEEEARLEHFALLNNENNKVVVKDMMIDMGINDYTEPMIIVSVGTSSTQCYVFSNDTSLTQYYYVGSEAILCNPTLIIDLLNKIKTNIDSHASINNSPIVFINSIAKCIKKTLYFNKVNSDDELLLYINGNDNNNDVIRNLLF